ncbi:DUF1858 domain-containing protein [Tepidicaulis sp.]|mgnify:FL=1|uniref:DUF1858 domain-containing protein n=1 Tax=Tepidicaulis sp. TaxID=1920809 RepID=UPI003B5B9657
MDGHLKETEFQDAGLTAQSIVGEVMRLHPATLPVFLHRHMHCPGCPMAPFMTLAEAAENYRTDLNALLAELNAACR